MILGLSMSWRLLVMLSDKAKSTRNQKNPIRMCHSGEPKWQYGIATSDNCIGKHLGQGFVLRCSAEYCWVPSPEIVLGFLMLILPPTVRRQNAELLAEDPPIFLLFGRHVWLLCHPSRFPDIWGFGGFPHGLLMTINRDQLLAPLKIKLVEPCCFIVVASQAWNMFERFTPTGNWWPKVANELVTTCDNLYSLVKFWKVRNCTILCSMGKEISSMSRLGRWMTVQQANVFFLSHCS